MLYDVEMEVYVGFVGLFVGIFGVLVCYVVVCYIDSNLLFVLLYMGFFFNLFNMILLLLFDGGWIIVVLLLCIWFVGVLVLIVLFVYWLSLLLIVMVIFVLL